MTSAADFKLAGAAAGFTLGFGLLTVWEAIKQTNAVRSPIRSQYIYMIWGEIFVNLAMGIIAWLMLDGVLVPTCVFTVALSLMNADQVLKQYTSAFHSSFALGFRNSTPDADYYQSSWRHC